MSLTERGPRRKAEVNIVPLVDVLIVLIFFFMVSMQFRNLNSLNLVLPKIETAGQTKIIEQVEIAIDAEGNFYFSGAPVNKEALESAVRLQADLDNEVPVLVMADEETYLKNVTYVMDLCRSAGLERLRLQSR